MSQPTQDVLLNVIKEMCANVASDFEVDAMQRDLLAAVATVVMNERAFSNGNKTSIQPETDNAVFDLGVRIIDNNWLIESGSE